MTDDTVAETWSILSQNIELALVLQDLIPGASGHFERMILAKQVLLRMNWATALEEFRSGKSLSLEQLNTRPEQLPPPTANTTPATQDVSANRRPRSLSVWTWGSNPDLRHAASPSILDR